MAYCRKNIFGKEILFFMLTSSLVYSKKICILPKGCELDLEKVGLNVYCEDIPTENTNVMFNDECWLDIKEKVSEGVTIYLISKNNVNLIEKSLKLVNLINNFKPIQLIFLQFYDFNGFNIETPIEIKDKMIVDFNFNGVELNFYDNKRKPIKTCDDLEQFNSITNISINAKYMTSGKISNYNFFNIRNTNELCPLLFKNINANSFYFSDLVNTYYKRNVFKFEKAKGNISSKINCHIKILAFRDMYEIDVDSTLIDENVFKTTKAILLIGKVKSIEVDLFKKFSILWNIDFDPTYFLSLVRRQGIDWIRSINEDVHINVSDFDQFYYNTIKFKFIQMRPRREYFIESDFEYVYEKDFCLFKDFPFDQLVFYLVFFDQIKLKTYSCTFIWLTQYMRKVTYALADNKHFIEQYEEAYKNINFSSCDFERMKRLCRKMEFSTKKSKETTFTTVDFMIITEFLLILFTPIVSFLGIVSNLIVILVIIKKENRKELKKKQYTYMVIHSVMNICVLFIEILRLMNECQLPFGIYCSSIRQNTFVQYVKIVFVEYFNCFFRLMSNFSYVAFALNRLSLIGKNHNPVTQFVADVKIKYYMAFAFFLSAGLPVVKALGYEIKKMSPSLEYPTLFNQDPIDDSWNYSINYRLILIFSMVYELINYVICVLINLIIDLLLVFKLKKVLKEREEKFKEQSEKIQEKIKTENQESIRRVINMVILNSLVSLLLKIPIVITSFNDFRLLFTIPLVPNEFVGYRQWFSFPYTMKYFCSYDRICEIFKQFGNFLFLISVSVNFFFLKHYDNLFHDGCQLLFGRINNKSKTKA